jgi:hypothetical protein
MYKTVVLHSSHALRLSGVLLCAYEDGIEKREVNEV